MFILLSQFSCLWNHKVTSLCSIRLIKVISIIFLNSLFNIMFKYSNLIIFWIVKNCFYLKRIFISRFCQDYLIIVIITQLIDMNLIISAYIEFIHHILQESIFTNYLLRWLIIITLIIYFFLWIYNTFASFTLYFWLLLLYYNAIKIILPF